MQRDFGRTATRKRNYVDGLAEELQRSIGHAPPFTGLPFAANTLCDQGLGQKAEEMQRPRPPLFQATVFAKILAELSTPLSRATVEMRQRLRRLWPDVSGNQ